MGINKKKLLPANSMHYENTQIILKSTYIVISITQVVHICIFLQVETPIKNLCCFNELMYSTICSIFFNIWCKETYCVDLCSLQKGSFNLVVYMMFQIFFMTFRNESEHCISNKTKLTYKCLSRMEEQSHQQAAPFLFLSFSGMDGYIWEPYSGLGKKWFFYQVLSIFLAQTLQSKVVSHGSIYLSN